MKRWIFALLLASQSAFAQWGMEMHLYTQHFGDMGPIEKNEKNYGLGLSYRFSENWKALAGIYRNSLTTYELSCDTGCEWKQKNINSRYISAERLLSAGENYEFGFGFGVADGYEHFTNENGVTYHKGSDYNFLAGPYLNIGRDYSLKIRYMFELASLGFQYNFH